MQTDETQETQPEEIKEEVVETTPESEEVVEDKSEDYRAKLNIQNRLLEKEGYTFENGKWVKHEKAPQAPSQDSGFSPKDYLALNESKVSTEDFDEVVRIAKILNKPISDALKDPTMKVILDTRAEERRTAQATAIKGGARGSTRNTGEDLLREAEELGKFPETAEGMRALAQARLDKKRKSLSK